MHPVPPLQINTARPSYQRHELRPKTAGGFFVVAKSSSSVAAAASPACNPSPSSRMQTPYNNTLFDETNNNNGANATKPTSHVNAPITGVSTPNNINFDITCEKQHGNARNSSPERQPITTHKNGVPTSIHLSKFNGDPNIYAARYAQRMKAATERPQKPPPKPEEDDLHDVIESIRDDVLSVKLLMLCSRALHSLDKAHFIFQCVNLRKLDLHNNKISTLAGTEGAWSSLPNLEVLYLHENNITSLRVIEPLTALPQLTYLTMFRNPVTITHTYRHYIVNRLMSLKALDDYLVADTEIIEGSNPNVSIYQPMSDLLRIPLPSEHAFKAGRSPEQQRTSEIRLIRLLHAQMSPVCAIQRIWRGYSVRRKHRQSTSKRELMQQKSFASPAVIIQRNVRRWLVTKKTLTQYLHNCNIDHFFCLADDANQAMRLLESVHQHRVFSEVCESETLSIAGFTRRTLITEIHVIKRADKEYERHRKLFPYVITSNLVIRKVPVTGASIQEVSKRLHQELYSKVDSYGSANLRYVSSLLRARTLASVSRDVWNAPSARRLKIYARSKEHLVRVDIKDISLLADFILRVKSRNEQRFNIYFDQDIERIAAAVSIQSFWRSYRVRKTLRPTIGEKFLHSCAGVIIQKHWRRFQAQERVDFIRTLRTVAAWIQSHEVFLDVSTYRCLCRLSKQITRQEAGVHGTPRVSNRGFLEQRRIKFFFDAENPLMPAPRLVYVYQSRTNEDTPTPDLHNIDDWLRKQLQISNKSVKNRDRINLQQGELISLLLAGGEVLYHKTISDKYTNISAKVKSGEARLEDVLDSFLSGYFCISFPSKQEAIRRCMLLFIYTYGTYDSTLPHAINHNRTHTSYTPHNEPTIRQRVASAIIKRWWRSQRAARKVIAASSPLHKDSELQQSQKANEQIGVDASGSNETTMEDLHHNDFRLTLLPTPPSVKRPHTTPGTVRRGSTDSANINQDLRPATTGGRSRAMTLPSDGRLISDLLDSSRSIGSSTGRYPAALKTTVQVSRYLSNLGLDPHKFNLLSAADIIKGQIPAPFRRKEDFERPHTSRSATSPPQDHDKPTVSAVAIHTARSYSADGRKKDVEVFKSYNTELRKLNETKRSEELNLIRLRVQAERERNRIRSKIKQHVTAWDMTMTYDDHKCENVQEVSNKAGRVVVAMPEGNTVLPATAPAPMDKLPLSLSLKEIGSGSGNNEALATTILRPPSLQLTAESDELQPLSARSLAPTRGCVSSLGGESPLAGIFQQEESLIGSIYRMKELSKQKAKLDKEEVKKRITLNEERELIEKQLKAEQVRQEKKKAREQAEQERGEGFYSKIKQKRLEKQRTRNKLMAIHEQDATLKREAKERVTSVHQVTKCKQQQVDFAREFARKHNMISKQILANDIKRKQQEYRMELMKRVHARKEDMMARKNMFDTWTMQELDRKRHNVTMTNLMIKEMLEAKKQEDQAEIQELILKHNHTKKAEHTQPTAHKKQKLQQQNQRQHHQNSSPRLSRKPSHLDITFSSSPRKAPLHSPNSPRMSGLPDPSVVGDTSGDSSEPQALRLSPKNHDIVGVTVHTPQSQQDNNNNSNSNSNSNNSNSNSNSNNSEAESAAATDSTQLQTMDSATTSAPAHLQEEKVEFAPPPQPPRETSSSCCSRGRRLVSSLDLTKLNNNNNNPSADFNQQQEKLPSRYPSPLPPPGSTSARSMNSSNSSSQQYTVLTRRKPSSMIRSSVDSSPASTTKRGSGSGSGTDARPSTTPHGRGRRNAAAAETDWLEDISSWNFRTNSPRPITDPTTTATSTTAVESSTATAPRKRANTVSSSTLTTRGSAPSNTNTNNNNNNYTKSSEFGSSSTTPASSTHRVASSFSAR